MLRRDKQGVSIMIGYVLLIVIAVSISLIVFVWLQTYNPLEEKDCGPDVSVGIENVTCFGGNVHYTIKNRGLFTIDGVQVRAGDSNRVARDVLSDDLVVEGDMGMNNLLEPGEEATHFYSFINTSELSEFEVQGVIYQDNAPLLCTNAVATRQFRCDP